MSYLKFAYPKKDGSPEAVNGLGDDDPFIIHTSIGGKYYYVWRNATARDAIKEKEGAVNAAEHNPSPIPLRLTHRYQDQNFIQCIQPLQLFRPQALEDDLAVSDESGNKRVEASLKKVVLSAYRNQLKVKAVGTGHSFSDIMTTPDFLVVTDDLKHILTDSGKSVADQMNIRHYPLVRQDIKDFYENDDVDTDHHPGLVEFEAGIKLFDLTDALWERGWSLTNLGTYQGQSFIGAVSTSTHGSGLKLGPLPDMIKSLVIVADAGITYRIEPKDGITSREELSSGAPEYFTTDFVKKVQNRGGAILRSQKDPGVDYLVQDDDFFYSALVNIGTFGIVYSVIIEVIPQLYLLEAAEITTWDDLKKRLYDETKWKEIFETKAFVAALKYRDGNIPDPEYSSGQHLQVKSIRQTSMLFNANYYNRSDKKVIFFRITRQYEVPRKLVIANGWADPNDKGRLLIPALKKLMQPIFDIIGERLVRGKTAQRKLYEAKLKLICGTILFEKTEKQALMETIAHWEPYLGWLKDTVEEDPVQSTIDEIIGDKLLNFIAQALSEVDKKTTAAMNAPIEPEHHEFYLNRNYRVHVKSSDLNGYGIETGFRFEKKEGQQNPDYIAAIERAIAIAEQHWEEGRYIQTATTAVRFVQASNAYLSPQYGETTCMIEMLNVADTHGGKELFYRYQKAFAKMGGRPHWGLDLSVTTGNNNFLTNTYPMFPAWKEIYDLLNNCGTFDNRFTDRMGLSKQSYPK